MSLNDVQHVEAVAIMRRLVDASYLAYPPEARDHEAVTAAETWLRENHPEPQVYTSALMAAS